MIECRGVSFSYDGAVPALDGVDLNIEDGEFFCILGGNGSGKSTFAKHLNALLQPDAGTVCVNGMDASDPELVYDIRSTAGMVFQNPDDQLVATLVEDPVKVSRVTLQNAASVASLILITEATVSDVPKNTQLEDAIAAATAGQQGGGMY